ncbi:uncharacterized protein LOC125216663 [Salvia hispanica]|uniref:uncharacterized protein LOC125216663 n=1 Tax=Salvia hispanica TaxID=49212 RepID=UPI0020092662|nr:uncharacterized protein LOC125216663 [Salvia hispanica]
MGRFYRGFTYPQGCRFSSERPEGATSIRYHLKEWAPGTDTLQNVIERPFVVLKIWWAILRSVVYYPVCTQIHIIMTCFLLHNSVPHEISIDPVEIELDGAKPTVTQDEAFIGVEYVDCVEPTQEWTQTRDNLAMNMWNNR